jgi:hypothetical protein
MVLISIHGPEMPAFRMAYAAEKQIFEYKVCPSNYPLDLAQKHEDKKVVKELKQRISSKMPNLLEILNRERTGMEF